MLADRSEAKALSYAAVESSLWICVCIVYVWCRYSFMYVGDECVVTFVFLCCVCCCGLETHILSKRCVECAKKRNAGQVLTKKTCHSIAVTVGLESMMLDEKPIIKEPLERLVALSPQDTKKG